MDADPPISCRILVRNLGRPICAAVIDNGVVPILVGLRKDALDALDQVRRLVMYRRYYTNQRLRCRFHSLLLTAPRRQIIRQTALAEHSYMSAPCDENGT